MAIFKDTPRWKKEQRWDSTLQRMVTPDKPPTQKQIDYLRALHKQHSLARFEPPTTRREAQSRIDQLKDYRRRGRK